MTLSHRCWQTKQTQQSTITSHNYDH